MTIRDTLTQILPILKSPICGDSVNKQFGNGESSGAFPGPDPGSTDMTKSTVLLRLFSHQETLFISLLMFKILLGEVMALITQFAEQVLDLFQRKRRRLCSPIFPSTDSRKCDTELGGEFLLTKPGTLPDLPDQSGDVITGIQLFSPLKLDKALIVSRFRYATYQVIYLLIGRRWGGLEDFLTKKQLSSNQKNNSYTTLGLMTAYQECTSFKCSCHASSSPHWGKTINWRAGRGSEASRLNLTGGTLHDSHSLNF
jgi:hypothetical protein